MGSPAISVKDLLVTANVGFFTSAGPGWQIRVGKKTETPNQQIICYDYGGEAPNPQWLVDFPSVQVMVRGNVEDYVATYMKMRECKDALLGVDSQDLNGERLVSIGGVGDINNLGYDDKERPVFSLNLKLIIEPATNALTHRESL